MYMYKQDYALKTLPNALSMHDVIHISGHILYVGFLF